MVKHPHIVRLHEVVETDRFIGIVLEYASGGELFEYILAHKHLRENMACKLFAQLISGVAYLHSKKIVHRDLKLENLLLDRNKDIVITDFGFANRFNDTGSDLMATSCGSPCYAAPELVLHDGQYVGSAVDVWSCGVILYAMLSGYLPYDDDPANPDGDNINLLYRYITTTQLSFPDWISPEPRELLLMMLVADPAKRCTLRDVMRHPWLKRYAPSFQKGVAELEMQAEAQYEEKSLLLARQQEHYFRSTGQALPPHLQRSQSSMAAFESQQTAQSMAQQRHRSAMVHSVTTQSMIPEFAAAPQNQQFQQPRPSLPIHLQGGLISPPLSPPSDSLSESTNRRPPASAYPAIQFSDPFAGMAAGPTVSSPLRQQQQQQLDASYLASSTAMQPSLSAPGDVETISDSLTSEGEMRGEPRSRKTDDDDASTTSSSNRGARSSAARGSSSMATPPIVPGSPAGTNLSNGDSKKRKGEEKRHTLPSLDYPASPPAESTRSKTKARDSLRDASDFPLLYHPDLPMPPVIAPFDRSSGRDTQLSMDPHMPIVEAAAAAESIDVHMQSPDASPARSTDDHNQSELSARAGQATSNGSTPGVATQPTVSPIEERGENILVSPASEQDRSLLPKMTAPQTLANQVTPPSSPRKEAVSPSRTPKRSNGSSAATAREALLADAQRTPKASAQQQQSLAQPAPSDAPRSSAVPFPSPSKEKRPSTAAATNFESADSGRGTTSSGKTSGSGSRHKKGLSISRLLGSSTTSVDRTDVAGEPSRSRKDSLQASRPPSAGPQGGLNSIEEDLSKSRNRRRKALSLVVDPFGRSSTSSSAAANAQAQAKNRRSARVQPISGSGSQLDASTDRTRAGTQGAARPSGLPASASAAQFPVSPSMASVVATPGQSRASLLPGPASQLSQSTYQPQAVEAKQRKRMSDWFKWSSSSSSRDNSAGLTQSASVAGGLSGIPAPPNTKRNSTSTRPQSMAQPPVTRSRQSTATQPTVVVTSANAIAQPQAQAQQQPQTAEPPRVVATPAEARTFASTHRSTLTAQRSLRNKVVGASEASYDGAFDDSKLKVHSGGKHYIPIALDAADERDRYSRQSALYHQEPAYTGHAGAQKDVSGFLGVLSDVANCAYSLQDMGMDIERDGDFRYRVTRRSRKQVSQQAGGSTVTSPSLGAMSPSPSSTFRSFFGRKNSAATTGTLTGQSMPSPALTTSSQLENGTGGSLESAMLSPTISNHSILQPQLSSSTNATVAASQKVNAVVPFYGGKSDSGGEVRYSVEVTRVRGLTGLYTLDFRRMKGSLSDYKANHVCSDLGSYFALLTVPLQDALLDRLDLGSPL